MANDSVLTVKEQFERLGQKVKHYAHKDYYATNDPTREDRRPSLLFGATSNGGVWFKDMAGISSPADILHKLGIDPETLKATTKDIKPAKHKPQRRRLRLDFSHPHAVYNYTYEDGQPAYQVRRVNFTQPDGTPDKEFSQYHWADGRWQPRRGETPELLYHLPEVAGSQRILIGEGEKVVEALRSLGYVATTHAGGSGNVEKALAAYKQWLRAKDVIILPDNDEAGEKVLETLAGGLHGRADSVRFVSPSAGGWDQPKADIADLIERLKKELLSNEDIRAILDPILDQAQPWRLEPGPKELERLATREQFLTEARTERQAKEARRQARQAELERRWKAGDKVNFEGDEEIDPDYIEYKRGFFTNAKKWRDYCLTHWPDLDAEEQYKIKLAENREARPGNCGDYRKRTLPNGQVETYRHSCGVCPDCLKRSVWIYRRALNEIQGIPSAPPQDLLESLATDDLSQLDKEAPRENAPPLPQVKGDLSILRVYSDPERLHLTRELRQAGIAYRTKPISLEDGPAYDFIVNDDRGDPLGLITDERIELWVKGAENKRASGELLPSLKKLQQRYREALPYEVVLPELDDEGQPVDPDIFTLELPDIGTTARLPGVVVGFEVHDAETLQAALLEIHREQWRILGRRGDVNYGVMICKKFYTRYLTLPQMLADFNARQEALKHKKRRN